MGKIVKAFVDVSRTLEPLFLPACSLIMMIFYLCLQQKHALLSLAPNFQCSLEVRTV